METTAIITRTKINEDYHERPIAEDPILMPFLLKIGIDFNNMNSVVSQLNEEDMRVDSLPPEELKQWKKNIRDKLVTKLQRCHSNQLLAKIDKKDKQLESEITEVKQYLSYSDSIDYKYYGKDKPVVYYEQTLQGLYSCYR